MKRRILNIMVIGVAMLGLITSCAHRELSDSQNTHYVRIYLDEQIKNVTCGFYNESYESPTYERPVVLRALLADPQTGEVVSEKFLRNYGEDSRGAYIEGYIAAEAGTYNFMVHGVGSSVTQLKNENNYYQMEAYTNPISEYHMQYLPSTRQANGSEKIVYEPEHLFHDICEPVVIPLTEKVDTIRNGAGDFFTAHTIALSYYVQVNIKGVEWVKSAAATLSGMGGSTMMCGHRALVESNTVSLFFTMNYADKKRIQGDDMSTALLYTTFTTFGKQENVPSIYTLNFEFIKTDGSSQVEVFDITDMFDTPVVKNNQWILLDREIVITRPEGTGGITPGVEGWNDIDAEITM